MAVVQANASFDMSAHQFLKVLGKVIPGSGTLQTTSFSSGHGVFSEVGPTIQWFGTGFSFSDASGQLRPMTGTATAVIFNEVSISNVNIDMADVNAAAEAGGYKKLMEKIFAGDDVFVGTDGSSAYPKDIRGVELFFGCAGDDQFKGSLGGDLFDGGKGFDEANYTNSATGITLHLSDLSKSTGYAEGDTFKSIEIFVGSLGADRIVGANKNGATLDGYLGRDTLVGGDARDKFCFSTEIAKNNVDRVNDFDPAMDQIMLRTDVFTEIDETYGRIAKAQFRFGSESRDADDRILFDRETGKLFYDPDGDKAGGKDPRLFAILESGADLTARDVIIY